MNTVIVENCKTLFIGRRGENEVTEVVFDFTEWQEQFGTGVIDLYVKRSVDFDAYPVVLSVDGTVATWLVTDADTAVVGSGKIEFVYTVNEKVAKSAIFPFYVGEDIGQASSEPPDPYESWIETLTELGTETQANAQAAAQSASDAADSAASASESAGQAEDSAEDAEAWAVGERDGEPVSAGDETYENNAKYWAENARANAPVQSVNGKDGNVELTLDDIPNGETYARATPSQLAQIGTNAEDIADIDEMIPNTTSESNPLVNVSFLTNRLTSYRTSAAQDTIDAGKQEKITAYGILKRDRSGNITAAVAGADYVTADALNSYRKATAQDAIDNAQNENINKNTTALNTMQPAATAADIGKALIVKTVADGKPTSYEYGEAGGGGSVPTAGDGIDISNDVISNTQGIEYIVGTQTAATAKWTGVSTDETLKVGKIIAYYLPFAGTSTAATLALTMADGTTTREISLQLKPNSTVTTQFPAGSIIILVYDGSYWRVNASYDTDTNTYPTGYCVTNGSVAAKAAACSFGYRGDTNYFPCLFRFANTAADATLAITTYAPEAAPIYVNGARTSASNTFGAGVILFLYYNGAYYCYNDGRFPILVDGTVTSVQEYAAGLLADYRTAAAQDTIDAGKQAKITASGILKGDGAGGVSAAVAGTDYLAPSELNAYRTAADQDVIDDAQDERIEDLEQTTTATTIGPVAIASFEASTADMPLKGLTVDIEPVQNLNGYDKPWPAGGGKNLLKYPYYNTTLTSNGITYTDNGDGSITVNGTATATADFYFFHSTASLPLSNGSYIFSSSYTGQIPDNGFYIRAKANAEDASYLNIGIGAEGSYTVSNGVFYIACIRVSSGKTLDNVRVYPMIRLASEADATFEPYSNICPITGWTGCNVIRTGKNLLNREAYTVKKTLNDAGAIVDGANSTSISEHIPVVGGAQYTFSCITNSTGYKRVAAYTKDGVFIAPLLAKITGITVGESRSVTFTTPANAAYLIVSNNIQDTDVQLELGSVATDYEPFGTTYNITFPSPDPGTIYGGTLDVVNGVLTVTHELRTFAGQYSWAEDTAHNGYRLLNALRVNGYYENLKSNMFVSLLTDVNVLGLSCGQNSRTLQVRQANTIDGVTDVDSWKNFLSNNPLELVVPLANAVTYQLTADEITTLLGTNNIWADCGDVTVTYGAYLEAVKSYADQVGDSILSAIAPLEMNYTASRAYAAGSFLFVGTKFYKVTASIASGDTINPGTNVTQTTVAEQLMALAANA